MAIPDEDQLTFGLDIFRPLALCVWVTQKGSHRYAETRGRGEEREPFGATTWPSGVRQMFPYNRHPAVS